MTLLQGNFYTSDSGTLEEKRGAEIIRARDVVNLMLDSVLYTWQRKWTHELSIWVSEQDQYDNTSWQAPADRKFHTVQHLDEELQVDNGC